jgi:hypothetical protein
MADIALISCTKTKRALPSPAALLYTSTLFNKSLLYALSIARRTYILSAKHGLLNLDDVIDPYDLSIKNLSTRERVEWASKVGNRLQQVIKTNDKVHLLAGREYYNPLTEHLKRTRCSVLSPLQGLSLGTRVSRLRKLNFEDDLAQEYLQFHMALKRLYVGQSGGRRLSECDGRSGWPERGLYLILESNELLHESKFKPLIQRVTRVGTHAVSKGSKATLWNRLSTHRGTNTGTGNHRSSIFRLHVGAALIASHPTKWKVPTWGVGQIAPVETQKRERKLEEEVSATIGAMRVLWLDIPDEPGPQSDRAFLERNTIGLLSRAYTLAGHRAAAWLGTSSPNIKISLSGLWNLNHLNVIPDSSFADVFSTYVDATLGTIPLPNRPLAPVAWYRTHRNIDSQQLLLFPHGSSEITP